MSNFIFDLDSNDFIYQMDDDYALSRDGHIIQKAGDNLGFDIRTGEYHRIQSWETYKEENSDEWDAGGLDADDWNSEDRDADDEDPDDWEADAEDPDDRDTDDLAPGPHSGRGTRPERTRRDVFLDSAPSSGAPKGTGSAAGREKASGNAREQSGENLCRYCRVLFDPGGMDQAYRMEDDSLREGDYVLAPSYETGECRPARVVEARTCRLSEVPYRLERLRFIEKKIGAAEYYALRGEKEPSPAKETASRAADQPAEPLPWTGRRDGSDSDRRRRRRLSAVAVLLVVIAVLLGGLLYYLSRA